jgi:radical SAM protein with 4Fe4S-binding SPASM domain
MIDIGFYMRTHNVKDRLARGESFDFLPEFLEECRSPVPVVFNVESTNACNMTCSYCPRTKLMTRPVKTMAPITFMQIVDQIEPHSPELWSKWVKFAKRTYNIPEDTQSENNFFLYIIPRVIVLHGYGDPLLDPHIPDYVWLLTRKGIPSYFSCNPSNIQLYKSAKAFENGLSYVKYSIDSLDTSARGRDAFSRDYPRVMQVLDLIAQKNYQTRVVITMINLGNKLEEFARLKEAFKGTGVYIYLKSLDQQWIAPGEINTSIHWNEPCQFPWSSLTVKSDGMVVACPQDFNNDPTLIMGDAKTTSLQAIWNGEAYNRFRQSHFTMPLGMKCTDGSCDMNVFGF